MIFNVIVTCVGVITNLHVTPLKESFYVEFKTGTLTACPMEIKIKDKKTEDLLGYHKMGMYASEYYKSLEDVTIEVPRIK